MAPIKFEENIREKLQERELQPSKEAWSKLESRLGHTLPEKKGNKIFWMSIAASLVGILLVVSYFFFGTRGDQPTEVVVNQTELPAVEEVVRKETNTEKALQEIPMEEVAASNDETDRTNASETEMGQMPKKESSIAIGEKKAGRSIISEGINSEVEKVRNETLQTNKAVAVTLDETPKSINKDPQGSTKEEGFFNAKVDEVVASIQGIQNANNTVTAEEIDELLRRAQRDIATQRILNSSQTKIDATALLNDVETELERSFRDKVFEALGDGYKKVRTAVAQRNN